MASGDCQQWIVHSGNCNYARSRHWFKDYTKIDQVMCGGSFAVGYGTVELEVKSPGGDNALLLLRDVLHIPSMGCNGFKSSEGPGVVGIEFDISGVYGIDVSQNRVWYARSKSGTSPSDCLGTLRLAKKTPYDPATGCHLTIARNLDVTESEWDAVKVATPRTE